jgi:threonine synthase
VLVITGEGLKTLDAVRDSFADHEVEPSIESFEAVFGAPVTA